MRRQSPRARSRALRLSRLKTALSARAGGRCEQPWCRVAAALDLHHVRKRSHGGQDIPDNLVALCRRCHERTDAPADCGRLEIVALGDERFRWRLNGEVMDRARRRGV